MAEANNNPVYLRPHNHEHYGMLRHSVKDYYNLTFKIIEEQYAGKLQDDGLFTHYINSNVYVRFKVGDRDELIYDKKDLTFFINICGSLSPEEAKARIATLSGVDNIANPEAEKLTELKAEKIVKNISLAPPKSEFSLLRPSKYEPYGALNSTSKKYFFNTFKAIGRLHEDKEPGDEILSFNVTPEFAINFKVGWGHSGLKKEFFYKSNDVKNFLDICAILPFSETVQRTYDLKEQYLTSEPTQIKSDYVSFKKIYKEYEKDDSRLSAFLNTLKFLWEEKSGQDSSKISQAGIWELDYFDRKFNINVKKWGHEYILQLHNDDHQFLKDKFPKTSIDVASLEKYNTKKYLTVHDAKREYRIWKKGEISGNKYRDTTTIETLTYELSLVLSPEKTIESFKSRRTKLEGISIEGGYFNKNNHMVIALERAFFEKHYEKVKHQTPAPVVSEEDRNLLTINKAADMYMAYSFATKIKTDVDGYLKLSSIGTQYFRNDDFSYNFMLTLRRNILSNNSYENGNYTHKIGSEDKSAALSVKISNGDVFIHQESLKPLSEHLVAKLEANLGITR